MKLLPKLCSLLAFTCFAQPTKAQDNICVFENYKRIELCLIETFSQEWYEDLVNSDHNDANRFYFELFLNKKGQVVGFGKYQLFAGISQHEFLQFRENIKKNYTFCISPHEDLSLDEYAAQFKDRIPHTFFYYPAKMSIFLNQLRLKE
jgi:hypothetical protein